MNELIEKLYFMLEDYLGQYELEDEETRGLETRRDALQSDIILRLGEDGQELMETFAELTLKLEDIRDKALFRAAMGLGAQIAQPRRSPWAAAVLSDRGTSGSGQKGGTRPEPHAPEGYAPVPVHSSPVKNGGS